MNVDHENVHLNIILFERNQDLIKIALHKTHAWNTFTIAIKRRIECKIEFPIYLSSILRGCWSIWSPIYVPSSCTNGDAFLAVAFESCRSPFFPFIPQHQSPSPKILFSPAKDFPQQKNQWWFMLSNCCFLIVSILGFIDHFTWLCVN